MADPWVKVGRSIWELGGPADHAIVKALREVDSCMAPLWCKRIFRRPDGGLEVSPRFVLARHVPEPREQDFNRRAFMAVAIYNVALPTPLPKIYHGLTSGPWLQAEVLEEEPTVPGQPGAFVQFGWQHVARAKGCTHTLMNNHYEGVVQEFGEQQEAAETDRRQRWRETFADREREDQEDTRRYADAQSKHLMNEPHRKAMKAVSPTCTVSETLLSLRQAAGAA